MRWRQPRLTIRLVMLAILVIGLLLGVGIYARRLSQRSAHYRRVASRHASIEQVQRGLITSEESMVRLWRNYAATWAEVARHNSTLEQALDQFFPGLSRDNRNRAAEIEWDLQQSLRRLDYYRAESEHSAALKRKYEHAASHPWEHVPPDPPEPAPPEPLPKPAPLPAPRPVEQPRWYLTRIDAHPTR